MLTINDTLARLVDIGRPWLQDYGLWAVAIGLFTETLVFTGVIVPGFGILVAAGYLAAEGVLSPWLVLLLAWTGAIMGDQASYAVGYFWGNRLFRRRKELVELFRRSVEDEGIWLLLTYHYTPAWRAVLPAAAGCSRYNTKRWLLYDPLGVFIWVAVVFGIGYTARGALKEQGNVAAQALNGIAALLMIYISLRIYQRLKRYRRSDAQGEAPAVVRK